MKAILKNILFVSLPTFIFMFMGLEVYTRIFKPHVDLKKITGGIPTPNPMSLWAQNDAFSAYTAIPGKYSENKTVNSKGFISTPEVDLKKGENTIRIIFLGESSTAGTGHNLADTNTWPWKVVEKLKAETGLKIDFINAALGGYSSFESYGKLWSRLRFFLPDIVIVYHGWNDMYYFNDKAENPLLWKGKFDISKPTNYSLIKGHWIDQYISWSNFFSILRYKFADTSSNEGEISLKTDTLHLADTFNRKGVEIFRQNIKLIRDFCLNNNIQCFVGKQGTLIGSSISEEDKKKCMYKFHGFNHDAHLDAFKCIYKVIDDEIPSGNIIDVTSLSGISENFYDHIHPTELGTDRISDIVKDSLISNYFRPRSR